LPKLFGLTSLARPALATLQKGGGSGLFVFAEMQCGSAPENIVQKMAGHV
jgi:hypothetical protein